MGEQKVYHVLNAANTDKIGFIGDSYTESHFSVEGKAYICKLSLFSDYNYENFAKSGDTYRGNLDRLRKNVPIYHDKLSWQAIKPKYAFFVSYTNDLKYMNEEQYLNDLRATIETVKGLGAMPIIATEYHTNFGPGLQIGLNQVAREYDCQFIDIIDSVKKVRGKDYAPFWGGSHPGTRSNHIMADNFEVYLNKLPRPTQSLKLFRLRDNFKEVEDLIFNTNEERARLFKEINVGHSCLVDKKRVDNVTSAEHDPVISEYLKLQNGEAVAFKDIALISAVLPASSRSLEGVALDLGETDAKVYVKDILKEPYPTPTFYQRFDIEQDYHVEVGDVYVSDNPEFKDISFTIKEVESGSLLALPYPRIATNIPGKLTKVSGKGAEIIPYPYTAIGFASDYPAGKAKVGHYIELEKQNGKYIMPKEIVEVATDYDKIHFLVAKPGDFNLVKVNVEWCGTPDKVYFMKELKADKARGKELIPYNYMGNEEQLSHWHTTNDCKAYVPTDSCLPEDAIGCVDVSEDNAIKNHIGYDLERENQEVEISILGRYFPEIYDEQTPYENCKITLDSYDYAEVFVDMTFSGRTYTQRQRVGLHWKDISFKTILPADTSEVELSIYSKMHAVQIAKVSMKKMK